MFAGDAVQPGAGRDRPGRRRPARVGVPRPPSPRASPTSTASPAATSSSSRSTGARDARRRDDGRWSRRRTPRRPSSPSSSCPPSREAMNQMMAAAAAATSRRCSAPRSRSRRPRRRSCRRVDEALDGLPDDAAHVTSGVFTVCGEPCRLVQLVPNAFVVRMTKRARRARRRVPRRPGPGRRGRGRWASTTVAAPAIPVRVWAELGRARMPSAQVVGTARRRGRRARPPGGRARSTSTSTARTSPPAALVVDGRNRLGRAHRARARRSTRPMTSVRLRNGGGPMARVLVVDDAAFMRKMVSDALDQGRPRGRRRGRQRRRGGRALPGAQARADDAGHHDAREGRPHRARRRSSRSTRPPA